MDWTWANSGGGPLVLLHGSAVGRWLGLDEGEAGDSHYDLACAVEGLLGTVPLGGSAALVLGDEPMMTAWVPLPRGGLLVRWNFADDEEHARAAVAALGEDAWTPSGFEHRVDGEEGWLVDAAVAGDEAPAEGAPARLVPGRYRVDTACVEDERTSLIHPCLDRVKDGFACRETVGA